MESAYQIEFKSIRKRYLNNRPIYSGLNLTVEKGEFLFITGISGAGKTTLFKMLLGLEEPDQGAVLFDGVEVNKIPPRKMPYHRRKIGVVFQDYKLLEDKSAAQNIAVPLQIKGIPPQQVSKQVGSIAERLEITDLLDKSVKTLSGGEQQKVAVARASVHSPTVLIADEPTANLDQNTAKHIYEILLDLNKKGITVIVASHDIKIIKEYGERIMLLKNGCLLEVH